MSIITMSMSQYEIEQDGSITEGYGDEVLCAGWNPAIALQQRAYIEKEQRAAIPPELAAADIDLFLKKMYAYQR